MAIGAGIGAQLGIATETTYNTAVTVSRFYEFNSENLQYNKKTVVGQGLRAGGQLPRSQRRVVATFDSTGDFEIDLPTRGLGLLLGHATGTLASPTTVSTGVYSYTFTLADVYGKSMTVQAGVPQYGGTVTPKTVSGAKVSDFSLSVANGDIAKGKFSIDGAGFSTTTPTLATASYSLQGSVFHFAQGAVTVDGSAVANIKDFTVSVNNTLKTDRYNLGASGAKAEQGINGFRSITGSMTAEFTDTTLLTKFLADTSAAIVVTFTGNTISSTYKETLSITIPAAKFNADTPNVTGPGIVDLAMSFDAYDNGTDQPLTIVYQSADSAL
jgi:hypothetical protein